MLWFTILAVWCASGYAHGAVPPVSSKPFYTEEAYLQLFTEFKVTYNKQYATPEEERHRLAVFKENLAKINVLNSKTKLAVYGINKFTDLTEEEMFPPNTRLTQVKALNFKLENDLPDVEKPLHFDWRKKNVVTKVKDQGRCQSGWAFAMMGVIEAQYAMKYKNLVDFSAQQLIDCDKNSDGCSGGNPYLTCGYLERLGAMTEKDYPFIDKNSTVINRHECAYNPQKVAVRVTGCRNHVDSFPSMTEVVKAVFLKGPVAVVTSAPALQHYRSGIIDDCETHTVNHGVLITGFGVDDKRPTPYLIVKNSWGEQWGEKGYFRISKTMSCLGIPHMYAMSADIE